ncbi:MAG: transcriptional regulator, TetR family [Acidobacteria bacterium]|nr:transcriptional regulator, TetR family [Acidobacteriota bacterium]
MNTPPNASLQPEGYVPPAEQDRHTRSRLLAAAVQVFNKKGYSAASVREIVELASVTKPALYYHFGSKEGVLLAILQEGLEEFRQTAARAAGEPGTTRERLAGLCEQFYGLFTENVPLIQVVHRAFHDPAGNVPDFDPLEFERSLEASLRRIVEEGVASGELRAVDSADVALAVLGVVGSAASRLLHSTLEPVSPERLRRVLDLVFDGVFKQAREQGE